MSKKKSYSVLIVAKQNKAGIRHAKKLETMIKGYTKDIHIDRSTAFRLRRTGTSIKKFRGDFIITVGGDGTFLMTSHRASVPILPVKIEGKGFLCTTEFKDLKKYLPRLFSGRYTITERMRLKCTKVTSGKISTVMKRLHRYDYPLSVNEVAFARKRPSKLLNIHMTIDGATYSIVGDGIMFFTPHGSTAYSASAGGPIIDPKMSAIGIIPLYPFYSKVKPFVVPADKKIGVSIEGGDCALVIDGHGGDFFKSNTQFAIEKARPVKVVSFEEDNFYDRVKKILID